MSRAYLAMGSNLGDRLANLQSAVDGLEREPMVRIAGVSSVYETVPVGGPEQPEYLNAVVAVDTDLEPRALLEVAQRLERSAHRVRTERWGPRTLDVDILLAGDARIDEPDLQIPHPRMWERAFVLAPLAELAPELVEVPATGWAGLRNFGVGLRVDDTE